MVYKRLIGAGPRYFISFWVMWKCSCGVLLIATTRCHFCWVDYIGSESFCRKVSNLVKFTAASVFIRRKSYHTHTHTHTHTHILPLVLQPAVGFGLLNNTSPFFPIYHQVSQAFLVYLNHPNGIFQSKVDPPH